MVYKLLQRDFFKKDVTLALFAALIFTITFSLAGFDRKCEQLRNRVLRLHILANSDSAEDQAIKLQVRDRLLTLSDGLYDSLDSKEQAIEMTKTHLAELKAAAEQTVHEAGGTESVSISIGKAYFETRNYENFTLPAGEYDAVRVLIGKAEGKNWWCVMFPALCIPAADSGHALEDAVDEKAAEIAKNAPRYEMRFKAVEIYEFIKQRWKERF